MSVATRPHNLNPPDWSERQAAILQQINLSGACAIRDLAERLNVSEETIRRDVRPLADAGVLRKVHGRVTLPEDVTEPPLRRRMSEEADAKKSIATAVATLVENGDTLFLDTGSTTIFVARALAAHRGLTAVTNSTEIARLLAGGDNKVFLAGGEMRADDGAVFGTQAQAYVRQFAARSAILSVGGLDPDMGLMDFHISEAEFSRALIERAQQVIVVADRTKFLRRAFVQVVSFDRIDVLVTNAPPPPELSERLAAAGVRVVVSPPLAA